MDDTFTYLIVTCDDETSVAASKRVTHRKGLKATISFYFKVRGVNIITCTTISASIIANKITITNT